MTVKTIIALVAGLLLLIVVLGFAVGITELGRSGRPNDTLPGQFASTSLGTGGGDLANGFALTEAQISAIFHKVTSTLETAAAQIARASQQLRVNPALVIAMLKHETTYGKNGVGGCGKNNNPGNISYRDDRYKNSGIQALPTIGQNRWAQFASCGDGVQAMIWLLRAHYLDQGLTTVKAILYKYAPPSDNNDTDGYIQTVERDIIELTNVGAGGTQ